MANSIRSNQNNLIRRPDGTLEPPAFNDSSAEDYARAFLEERERIKRERRTEIREREYEEQRKENRNLREELEDAVNEKIQEKVDGLIPKWATPLTDTIKWAEENKLRVQSILLGLPDELTPEVKWSDLPPEAKPDYTPPAFDPPRQWWYDFVSGTPPQAIPLKGDKSYYALWKYTGNVEVAEFRLNIPGSSQNVVTQASYGALMSTNPIGFSWAVTNPQTRWFYNYWNNVFPPGINSATTTGTSNRGIPDTWGNGFFPSTYGGQFTGSGGEFTLEEIAAATSSVSYQGTGFIRYYPKAKITGAYVANANGRSGSGQYITVFAPCEILFAVKIYGRQSLAIPEMMAQGTWSQIYAHNTPAGNYARQLSYNGGGQGFYYKFYRGLNYDPFEYDAFLCWMASTIKSPSRQYFPYSDSRQPWGIYPEPYLYEIESNAKYPKPRLSPPPPPPPKPKCDCMSNCCPQNKSDLEDLKRLLRAMQAKVEGLDKKIGEPQSVSLWDVDVTQQGSKVETRKPSSVLTHLALVNERIEMALRVIGIHEIPIEVEASASVFDGFSEMLMSSPVAAIQTLGKELKARTTGKTRITSLMQYLDWVSDTLHQKIGHFEQEVDIKDLDLIKEGDQSSKIFFPDMGSMLNATYKYSVDSAVKSQAITSITIRTLLELISVKKMLAEIGFQVDATSDYLGYDYTEESIKMKVLATLGQSLGDLPAVLKESQIDIKKQVLSTKEQPLESKLVELLQAAAITKAINTIPLGRDESKWKDILGKLLDATKNMAGETEGDYDKWLEQINKFTADQEIPTKIEKVEPPAKK